jgi:hypothetical protein
MYLFCNSRIHVITLYSGYACVYYASMLRCWHLVWILVRTDHPWLGVGCHRSVYPAQMPWITLQGQVDRATHQGRTPSRIQNVENTNHSHMPSPFFLPIMPPADPVHLNSDIVRSSPPPRPIIRRKQNVPVASQASIQPMVSPVTSTTVLGQSRDVHQHPLGWP